ncbi:hypothetical protein [Croceivirga sp. JEA036]|uniref:hypothetical protein n=1 Tax=Croceivirga sp. JEA036 TaxID=2721162 RepID=UPI001438BAA9|nr:hypothetical protein [Croceivirga sp. JEA036]NJB36286.1 hypothetical protein [Croceivirga sp. JEA036]
MDIEGKSGVEVLQLARGKGWYPALVQQLQKDFGLARIDFKANEEMSVKSLKRLVKEKVFFLLMEDYPSLLNLLYVMDIEERKLQEIKAQGVVEVADEISDVLLRRMFKKIWLRKKYST